MTAFGKKHFVSSAGAFYLEIYSVNKRNLDIAIYSPRDLSMVDYSLRQWVQSICQRGTVTVKLIKEPSSSPSPSDLPQLQQLEQIKHHLDMCASKLQLQSVQSIEFLTELAYRQAPQKGPKDFDLFLKEVEMAFKEAGDHWLIMKKEEGQRLEKDISTRLQHINQLVERIESQTDNSPKRYFEKLKKRLDDAGVFESKDDEKVIKEVVIFSEKIDTTEELIRLKSHLKQFQDTLRSDEKSIGRKLDFIIQEMNREVNSLGVKCQDLDIVKQTLEIKSEIEKIREQVQNIE